MKKFFGFTLVEMLLVLVIIGALVTGAIRFTEERYLNLRVDKTATQMQQILNAALSYYVDQNTWPTPTTLNDLRNNNYLPKTGTPLPLATSPWFTPYTTAVSNNRVFYVVTEIPATMARANSIALSIIGMLPLAYTATNAGDANNAPTPGTCSADTPHCYVVAGVNIPVDNLNNRGGIKFAGAFHHGACVPVPNCPSGTNAEIYPVIASATGLYNNANDLYPITSMSAYYTGDGSNNSPPACSTSGSTNCLNTNSNDVGKIAGYWRVCMQVLSQRGASNYTDAPTGLANGVMMVFTRCASTNEPKGSDFSVWSN